MADLADRIGIRVRLPARRQLTSLASIVAATQGEAVFSFLGSVVLVRVAGTEAAGRVFFAQSLASVWFMLWDPRLEDAALRFVPAHQATSPGRGTWLFARLLVIDVAVNLLVAVVGVVVLLVAAVAGLLPGDQARFLILATVGGGMAAAVGSGRVGCIISGRLSLLGMMRLAVAAVSFMLTAIALVADGPAAYLVAAALVALASTVAFALVGCRVIARTYGPSPAGPVPMPEGIVRFAVKSSAAASVAAGSDSSVLTLAGLLGGPHLVTLLKVAGSPARLVIGLASAAATQLSPRMASLGGMPQHAAMLRRDILRTSALLAVLGAVMVCAALPLAAPLLGLMYGPEYANLAPIAVVLLAAACVQAVVIWAKVLPLALGRPGLRLAFVAANGALVVTVLLAAALITATAERTALAFAWGSVAVAALGSATWLAYVIRRS